MISRLFIVSIIRPIHTRAKGSFPRALSGSCCKVPPDRFRLGQDVRSKVSVVPLLSPHGILNCANVKDQNSGGFFHGSPRVG